MQTRLWQQEEHQVCLCSLRSTGQILGLVFRFLLLAFILILIGRAMKDPVISSVGTIDKRVHNGTVRDTNSTENTIFDVINNGLTSPVLLVCANDGFLDFLTNLMLSISRLNLSPNILIICEDVLIYHKLSQHKEMFSVHYRLALTHLEKSLSEASAWKSDGYIHLVRKRPRYVGILLSHGIDVLYVDTDIVWLGDPFPFFTGVSDIYIQQELEESILYCAGFFYMRSNIRTITFVDTWAKTHFKGRRGIQRAFNDLLAIYNNISVAPLPTSQFCSGHTFFSSKTPWAEREPPVIEVHANFIAGFQNKKESLMNAGLWFLKD
ncbi:uncharacterized protein [Apostichopus japonicus]|uniref:uncharacterized protein n=1 Tax=Stichopus japonicus TaxID=307972 RepID=UPI003AB23892